MEEEKGTNSFSQSYDENLVKDISVSLKGTTNDARKFIVEDEGEE